MTEVAETSTPAQTREPLVVHGFYNRHGRVMMAVDPVSLVQVVGDDTIHHTATPDDELMEVPGSFEWCTRMVRIRRELNRDLANERRELRELKSHVEALGEAIREKAVEHDLKCEEYDEFAERWDLPRMQSMYLVTVSVQIMARDADDAKDFFNEHFSILDTDEDRVASNPEYYVESAPN